MNYFIKKTLMVMALVCSFSIADAQNNNDSGGGEKCFDGNSHIINLGVGLGYNNYYSAYRGYGYNYRTSPAFSLSYEHAVPNKLGPGYLGIGLYLGYQNSNATYNYYWDKHGYNNYYYYRNNWTNFMVAFRAAYHPDALNFKKGEIYFGGMAGLRIQSYRYETNNPDPYADNYQVYSGSSVFPTFSIFAGGRVYLTKNVALFAELGYGISYATGGLSFKF
ncbi:MAG: hypothetical protein H0W61_02500 [Bacteroidetes bacterium]|nr:hypothetical protein [Bacteroidota bacterium]